MSKGILIGSVILIIIAVGIAYFITQSNQNPQASSDAMMKPETESSEMMMDDKSTDSMMQEESRYRDYSVEAFDAANDKKRVYFFHATWCPTCKAANIEFNNNLTKIPEDVILFKTDYDDETELKKKFNITYQHTFVLVDAEGNEIKKWNGGAINELIANTK